MLGQLLLLVLQPLEQLTNQRSCLGGESGRIRCRKITRTKHASNDASARRCQHRHIHRQRLGQVALAPAQARVMTLSSGRRCHGRPRTKASKCAGVSDSKGVASLALGQTKRPRVEPALRAPHAKAIVYQQLDARAAGVGEQVAMMRLRRAEDLHNARQQALGARAHVDRVCGQPHRVDADHRSSSSIQATHSLAALAGQVTVTTIGPRRSSMRTSGT